MPVPVDLSKLSDVVKNDFVKQDVYDNLAAKVNSIDTSRLVLKTKYDTDKSELENKIPDTSGLVKGTDYDAKITDIESKIPDISNLATKTLLTTVESKIPSVSNLVKKTDYNTKTTKIENKLNNHNHDRYITTPESNTLAPDVFNARLKQADFGEKKTDFDCKLSNLNRKITKNKTDHLLVQNEFKKLQIFDSSYFIGKNYFENHGTQNYLAFQPMFKYLKRSTKTDDVIEWKSKGLVDEIIKPPDIRPAPTLGYDDKRMYLTFNGDCLKQDKFYYTPDNIINIYIVYDLTSTTNYNPEFTLENCLFGSVKITKNTDANKYKCSGYGIGFDGKGFFTHPAGSFGNNATIFGYEFVCSY